MINKLYELLVNVQRERSNDHSIRGSATRLYGVGLSQHLSTCCGAHGHVPLLVTKCIEALHTRDCINVVGLYRVSPSMMAVQVKYCRFCSDELCIDFIYVCTSLGPTLVFQRKSKFGNGFLILFIFTNCIDVLVKQLLKDELDANEEAPNLLDEKYDIHSIWYVICFLIKHVLFRICVKRRYCIILN